MWKEVSEVHKTRMTDTKNDINTVPSCFLERLSGLHARGEGVAHKGVVSKGYRELLISCASLQR